MKTNLLAACTAVWLLCAFSGTGGADNAAKKNTERKTSLHKPLPDKVLIERGRYLVTMIGCGDCHSPKKLTARGPVPDMDRYLSGYDSREQLPAYDGKIVKTGQWVLFNGQNTAAAGPWGVSFAANLTPDETGIGSWSLQQFTKAMRQGKYKGLDNTRPLLPPMPWPNYAQISDPDMKAIFTYLKSIKPVSNAVPAPLPPTP
ncbi:diheme cytochrome c-553 [Dyadobacter sandarakinus]|uniref:Diheme cytochrome c-553 n=1 Tax=Dyadobacter sandarakinus TaxID=2747268 RepID=A0ABX7I2M7_9BACT|nr:diheme cytochrome c-553 [Dyadobacter sandarakinus]QRR00309.1 diheme cytochrome c-553 [Dyadobacter sandarakinus]